MEEETALVDRVLTELEHIVDSEPNLLEFEIIPVMENEKNTSPLLFENNSVALEMWCVKYIIMHAKSYLSKMRNAIRRNLSDCELRKIKRSLLGAVLIQPEVTTYWNMRKELIENGYITMNSELYVTRLVLTRKNKCNEAFSQRRWVFMKAAESKVVLVSNELKVAEMTSRVTKNNYHAWTHRIWTLQNLNGLSKQSTSAILSTEFKKSYDYVFVNVSEHSAFHYRQKLIYSLIKHREKMGDFFEGYKRFAIERFKLNNGFNSLKINETKYDDKFENFKCFFSLLIYELFHTITELNDSYPGHESIWYHRRFVIKSLFDEIFCNINNRRRSKIDDNNLSESENLISKDLSELLNIDGVVNEEKKSKLFKSEFHNSENIICFKEIINYEFETIKSSRSTKSDPVQRHLADRYEKWLICVLQINID